MSAEQTAQQYMDSIINVDTAIAIIAEEHNLGFGDASDLLKKHCDIIKRRAEREFERYGRMNSGFAGARS